MEKKTRKVDYLGKFIASLLCLFLLIQAKPKSEEATWGFAAHKRINQLAVFGLPSPLFSFFKKNMYYLQAYATQPDSRRYSVPDEAPRHFIDLDQYPDSIRQNPPLTWKKALSYYPEDTLKSHGIVPWHIQIMQYRLRDAFAAKDPLAIIRNAGEIGHYIADANVPLHTTHNYNGQFSNQHGIHGLWETRIPEVLGEEFDCFVGQASYEDYPAKRAWKAVLQAHAGLDSLFLWEQKITLQMGEDKKYAFEEKNGLSVKVYSAEFSRKLHQALDQQVERQLRASVKMVADMWLTAWIDAGQPDLSSINFEISEAEKARMEQEKLQILKNIRKEADED